MVSDQVLHEIINVVYKFSTGYQLKEERKSHHSNLFLFFFVTQLTGEYLEFEMWLDQTM